MQRLEVKTEAIQKRLSMQPDKQHLQKFLPQMSSRSLRVWHALGNDIVAVICDRIMVITKLSESEVQLAPDELLSLGVITQSKPS